MKTLIALLLLTSVAMADPAAERAKAMRSDLIVVAKADLAAANAAAVAAFGQANSKMFVVGVHKSRLGAASEVTHYVASVRMTPAERAKFDKAFATLLTARKVDRYQKSQVKTKLTELSLAPVEAIVKPPK